MLLQATEIMTMQPVVVVLVLTIFTIVNIMLYVKWRVFLIIMVISLFSILFGVNALTVDYIPLTPWTQSFFIVIHGIILFMTALEMYRK